MSCHRQDAKHQTHQERHQHMGQGPSGGSSQVSSCKRSFMADGKGPHIIVIGASTLCQRHLRVQYTGVLAQSTVELDLSHQK